MITDWLDPVSYKLGVAAGGGGGSNPNYVETITGTLANPWGTTDFPALVSAINAGDASVTLHLDASSIGGAVLDLSAMYGGSISVGKLPMGNVGLLDGEWSTAFLMYEQDGSLSTASVLVSGQTVDFIPYATLISTAVTIIHHPLP